MLQEAVSSPFTIQLASPANTNEWNRYVAAHPLATPYHRMAWQHAVEKAYGHQPAGLLARSEAGEVVGVLPAVLMTIPFRGKTLCSLPYCDAGFAIADTDEVKQALYEFIGHYGQRHHARHCEVRDIKLGETSSEALIGQKVRMMMPLPADSTLLLASFKSKLRSQIRKAEKNGLHYKTAHGKALLEDFYTVYSINMRDLGSPVHHLNWFRAIIDAYGDHAVTSVVYNGDTAIGAGIVLRNNTQACIPWASTIQSYNRLAPNMLLYWSLLAYCTDNQVKHFDFGRSTYNEGTFKFKKQWGAEPELLDWYSIPRQPEQVNIDSGSSGKLRPLLESVWRKLPLSVTVKFGARIRRYISL